MKQIIFGGLMTTFLFFLSCNFNSEEAFQGGGDHFAVDRPHDPWVFRSVLDEKPRMLTLALHEKLWAAYDADHCALYKVWKGEVNFDGAVYTTTHGPQPTSIGDAYIVNEYEKPWLIIDNGKEIKPTAQYKGHIFQRGHVQMQYELSWDGKTIKVGEQVEYQESERGLTIFERIFTTKDVPQGVDVVLQTNVSSIALKKNMKTDGEFEELESVPMQKDNLSGLNRKGKLKLKSNATTRLASTFVKKPMIENSNKLADIEKKEKPLGYRLIARNDCKTCHNTYKKTIGPAYVDVARRYPNNDENIAMLTAKVVNGGSGVWGQQAMNAHPNVPREDIVEMIKYIMDLDAKEEVKTAKASATPQKIDYKSPTVVEDDDLLPGILLRFHKYEDDLFKLANINFKQKTPYEGIVPHIYAQDPDLVQAGDNFAMEYTGYLQIPETNNYAFRLISDDGSRLFIDGQEVIDHDGLHGATAEEGSIGLEKGVHPFRVIYFQGRGGKNVALEWQAPGSAAYEVIPKNSFLHHRVKHQPDDNAEAPPLARRNKVPGDAAALKAVHPSYDLSQARPDGFTPKVGGIGFLSDGRMVLSTWDAAGSVFILDGVQSGDPSKVTVKTIAKGFAEPLGLKVVDDEIYVLQKQELTQLIDHNGDDYIDEYRTVCNAWLVSANFHEFAFGLAYKDGYFYATLATAINPGGASTQPQIPDRGKVVKISRADGSHEFIAHGLRTPNGVGIGVDGEVFVTDNQGDWLPSSKVVHVQEGAWFGSRSVDFEGTANLTETLPVVWLPQDEIGNSPSTPLAINDGPYKGQMIHGEVTNGGIKRVFVEKVNGAYQGCLFRFIQGLEAGVNRLAWGPDGALYVGGIGSTGNWGHTGKLWYGLQRLAYNGQSAFEMLAVRAKSNGIEVEFTEALSEGEGWNPEDYLIKQWRYEPTKEYGGPKLDETQLKVLSASVSNDRKRVFLELEGMKEGHVIYIQLLNHFVSAMGHSLWTTEGWYTMNQIPVVAGVTKEPIIRQPNTLTNAEKAEGWQLLFDGKTTNGWRNFRKEDIGSSWKIADGTLMLDAKRKDDGGWQASDGGDIITEGEYENFELELEWKIGACGNSGIMYNVVESDEYDYVWRTGPEMQVLDNTCHPDAKIPTHRAGDLYDMIECSYVTVKPAGQWNKVRIIINNGQVEHWLNGYKVVEFEMFTDQWTQMIADSKFSKMPDFGKARKGHISLQDHGDPVWYRNIRIRELKPTI
ncbi:MAG: family 16 glycoside hydrolase [Bacteroidota bacterium]